MRKCIDYLRADDCPARIRSEPCQTRRPGFAGLVTGLTLLRTKSPCFPDTHGRLMATKTSMSAGMRIYLAERLSARTLVWPRHSLLLSRNMHAQLRFSLALLT